MAQSDMLNMSMDFAVRIIGFCESISGHRSIANQLERSATSIGANIREAKYAHSRADFVAKLQIALKECYETEYWLELVERASIVGESDVKEPLHQCGALRRVLVSAINTSKKNGWKE